MSLWRYLTRGIGVLVSRERADRDLGDELRHFIDEAAAEHERRGLAPADARRAARVEAGSFAAVRDEVRESTWEHVVFTTVADVRYALRQWRANPGFAAVAIASLALGIGATTAIYSAVRPVLFDALPYPNADRLTKVLYAGDNGAGFAQTFGTFCELEARAHTFARLAAFKAWQPTLVGPDDPERIEGQRVTAGYFRTLGVAPALGTDFHPDDDRPHGPDVIVLSDSLWRRQFGADPAVVGRQITLDDRLFTVAGVMPPHFDNVLAPSAEAWTLLQYDRSLSPQGPEWGHHLHVIGRLRAGSTLADARRELDAIARNRVSEFQRQPQASMSRGLIVVPLHDDLTREVRPALTAVATAVLVLLAIACVNVTNLLAARGARRRSEFAMRAALGANRGRLIRQLIAESALLSVGGGAIGVLLAAAAVRAFAATDASAAVLAGPVTLDRNVGMFAAITTGVVGVLVGLVPAFAASADEVRGRLHGASRRSTASRNAARGVLVAAEVALSVVLLVAAGLLLRSVDRLFALPLGFEPDRLLTMQVQIGSPQRFSTAEAVNRFFGEALDAVRATASVSSAAFTSQLPLSGDDAALEVYGVQFERREAGRTELMPAYRYTVTPGYFETMQIPLRRGRLLSDADRGREPRPVVVSESFARRAFGGADPIGERVRFGGPADRPWDEIVGVVGDVKQSSLAATEANAVYVDAHDWLWADPQRWLVVRARDDASRVLPAVRRAVWSVDRNQPIVRARTMDALIGASEQKRRYVLTAFEAFGAAALALAAIGIYGILAASVAERTREIGVRTALGASAGAVAAMVVRQGLVLTAAGIACGLVAAAAVSRVIAALLFGTSPTDPLVYASGAVTLIVVALASCCIPAYRAARIDPAIALRAE